MHEHVTVLLGGEILDLATEVSFILFITASSFSVCVNS